MLFHLLIDLRYVGYGTKDHMTDITKTVREKLKCRSPYMYVSNQLMTGGDPCPNEDKYVKIQMCDGSCMNLWNTR